MSDTPHQLSMERVRIVTQLGSVRPTDGTTAPNHPTPSPAAPPSIPDALRPWQEVFSAMAPEHLRLLATLMAELQPLIEEPETAVPQTRGEFDSYDGIASKGEIERLLPTEWLWRELDEPEFLRRLVENELLYHNVRHRLPSENRAFGVLIDCGPWMLGRPRLVALAALLCLGRRAHRDRIPLYWRANNLGASAKWNEGFGRTGVEHFLKEVSPTDFSQEAIEGFVAAPPHQLSGKDGKPKNDKPPSMRWYVIGPRLHDFSESPFEATQIVIGEKTAFDADGSFFVEADVSISSRETRPRSVTLPFPPEDTATALLRDPFREPEHRPLPQKPAKAGSGLNWPLKHVAVMHGGLFVLVNRPDGVLILDYRDRQPARYFLPLRDYEKLVGIRADGRGLTVALMMRYLNFQRLIMVEYQGFTAGRQMFELRLAKDEPFCQQLHGPEVLPLLARPGKRSVFWTYGADGKPYTITSSGIRPEDMLGRFDIIKCLSDYVLVRNNFDNSLSFRPMKGNDRTVHINTVPKVSQILDENDILADPHSGQIILKSDEGWISYGERSLRPLHFVNIADSESVLAVSQKSIHGDDIAILYGYGAQGLFLQPNPVRPGNLIRIPISCGNFRPDFAVPYKNSPHPLFVKLGEDGYPAKILRRLSDDAWMTTDVASEMERATCLRD